MLLTFRAMHLTENGKFVKLRYALYIRTCLSVCLSFHPSVCLSLCLSVSLSVFQLVYFPLFVLFAQQPPHVMNDINHTLVSCL